MIPRPEYPRPQFVRAEWLCLNGSWQFEFDEADDGESRGLIGTTLASAILVPFAPESELSGIGDVAFHEAVWYRRDVTTPSSWTGRRVILHFQAADHDTTVWVNGAVAGRHRGAFTPFSFDITDLLDSDGTGDLAVRVRDSSTGVQARGKQSRLSENHQAWYTRTTGIWQTVWLEPVSATHLERPRITPDVGSGTFRFELPLTGPVAGAEIDVLLADDEGIVATGTARAGIDLCPTIVLSIPDGRKALWSPENPHLYDVTFIVRKDGVIVDQLGSYAGLRSIAIDGKRVLINGAPVFQRLVLDQGWYPAGLMTAPTEADLVADIELGLAAGFNGARLHQKVFEERYLFHADRLGYLVWGEFGDWGANLDELVGDQQPTASFVAQWIEALVRDYSHPSIIGWCPLNETFQPLADGLTVLDDVTLGMYLATKAMDLTRPVLDTSGYAHRVVGADIYDSHSYEQDPAVFAVQMTGLDRGDPYVNVAVDGTGWSLPYAGQPYFCSEFAGIWWSESDETGDLSWGYGNAPATKEDWYQRAEGLFAVLLENPDMFGYCFTQLTDVFQEKNGVVAFDRTPKFDLARISAAQKRPAAFEAGGTDSTSLHE